MKSSKLPAIGTALVGFALGWILKPAGESPVAGSPDGDGGAPPRQRPGSELVAPEVRDANEAIRKATEAAGATDVATKRILANMGKSFDDIQSRRDRAKLMRLVEALGLDEKQAKAVAALLKKFRKGSNPYDVGDMTDHDAMLLMAANAKGEFEEGLRALLNEDQLARLDAYKEREHENRVETQAQRKLTKLSSSLDLSAEQRTTLLGRFRQNARDEFASEDEGWSVLDRATEAVGGVSGPGRAYRDLFRDPGFLENPEAFRDKLRERENQIIDEELQLVEDVLTDAQLEEYRENLRITSSVVDMTSRKSLRDPRFAPTP